MQNTNADTISESQNEVHHKSAGGYVFFNDPIEGVLVALVKKTDGTYWVPKGHIKDGEDPESAAKREIVEELGVDRAPELIGGLGVDSYSFSMPNDSRVHYKDVHIFVYKFDERMELTTENLEESEKGRFLNPEWLSVNEAETKLQFDSKTLLGAVELFHQSISNQG